MSERLIILINNALIKGEMEKLRKVSGLSENAIREIAKRRRVPRQTNAYNLALACEVSEQEALALARECLPARAKKAG